MSSIQDEPVLMQYEDSPINCIPNVNCKIDENAIPLFQFPTTTHPTQGDTEVTDLISSISNKLTTISNKLTKISNKLTTIWDNVDETTGNGITSASQILPTTTAYSTENIVETTLTDIQLDETTTFSTTNFTKLIEELTNATAVEMVQNSSSGTNFIGITESISNTSITELLQNGTSFGNLPNSTNIVEVIENISNSSISEVLGNGTLSFGSTSLPETQTLSMFVSSTSESAGSVINSTIEQVVSVVTESIHNVSTSESISEVVGNGSLSFGSTSLPETQTVSTFVSSTSESAASVINSTIEQVVSVVTEGIHNVSTTLQQKGDGEDNLKPYHAYGNHPNGWLYILLGIIAAILLIIGVILFLIYIRYRKHSLVPVHNYYEISPMKESCSPTHSHHENCTNEFYSQYST